MVSGTSQRCNMSCHLACFVFQPKVICRIVAINEGLIGQHQNKASHEHETGFGFISDMTYDQ